MKIGRISFVILTLVIPAGYLLAVTDHAQLTTGDAHWSSRLKQWFAMIKDDKNRFPNNPLWGDGWGWALFKADAPDNQVSTNHQVDCISCNVPAKTTDWVYVEG